LLRLGQALGVALPEVRKVPPASQLFFPGDRARFAREMAGAGLQTACGEQTPGPVASEEVLARSLAGVASPPAVVQRRVGRGRVVLSVLARPAEDRLFEIMESDLSGGLVVPILLLRELYGQAAWHAPAPLANWTID